MRILYHEIKPPYILLSKWYPYTFRGRRTTSLHFDESVGGWHGSRIPFFIADITLSIPNVVSFHQNVVVFSSKVINRKDLNSKFRTTHHINSFLSNSFLKRKIFL